MAESQLPEIKKDGFLSMIILLLNKHLNENNLYGKFDGGVESSCLLALNIKEQAPEQYAKLASFCGIRDVVNDKIIWGYQNPECATNAYFIQTATRGYINSSSDRSQAAGRLFWQVLKNVNINSEKHEVLRDKKFFQESANFDKIKISFLNGIGSVLDAKDKIAGIDWLLSYRKTDTSGVYVDFIRDLASYNIGANDTDREYLAKHTVRQLVGILHKSRESNGGKFLEMVLPVIENAANNAIYLENVSYCDERGVLGVKNEVYTFDETFKQDLYKRLKRSKLNLSENIIEFLENNGTANQKLQKRIRVVDEGMFNHKISLDSRYKLASKQKGIIETGLFAPNVKPTNDLVSDYAKFLVDYAVLSPIDKKGEVEVRNLECLLKRNANYMELNVVSGNLFGEDIKNKPNINKKLVNKVADLYAKSIDTTYDVAEEFSDEFHQKMTDMFVSIVKENNYKKSEVTELCNILSQGGGKAKEFVRMSHKIMSEYTSLPQTNILQKLR